MGTYTASIDFRPGECLICKDGHTLIIDTTTGRRFHELPEPAGSMNCAFQPAVETKSADFDAELWIRAEDVTRAKCNQIHVSFYSDDPVNLSEAGKHVVRDGSRGMTLWEGMSREDNYAIIHGEAERVARLAQIKITGNHFLEMKKAYK